MIKKLNKEIDNLPIIVKIIACIIMTILITLMSFLFVSVVNAQTTTYPVEAWGIKYSDNTYSNDFANNTTQSNPMPIKELVVSYQNKEGVLVGTIWMTIDNTNINNINQFRVSIYNNNTYDNTGTTSKNCTIGSGTSFGKKIRCEITFNLTNTTPKWLQILITFDTNINILSQITINGQVVSTPAVQPATAEDLQSQTISIINNAIENAMNQSQTIINESNTLGNRIESIINSATNSIQTTLNTMHCEKINNNNIKEENKRLANDGTTSNDNGFGITDYINIENAEIQILRLMTSYASAYGRYCFYNYNKEYLQCQEQPTTTGNITIPTDAYYVRFTIRIPQNRPEYAICRNSTDAIIENQNQNTDRFINYMVGAREAEEEDWEEEKGLLQSILSAIGGIFSSSIDDPSNTLNSFNNSIATDNTISSLLLLPVRLYQNVLNNINGSCNSFNLGTLYNHQLTMTCIQPQSFLGSALYGVIDVIISGFFILHIRKKFVDIFNHLTSLRTGGNELE